jgi:hypothetical protein
MTAQLFIKMKNEQTININSCDIDYISIKYPREQVYDACVVEKKPRKFKLEAFGNDSREGIMSSIDHWDIELDPVYEIQIKQI